MFNQNDKRDRQNVLSKPLPVGKVFLTIYGLMAAGFILYFMFISGSAHTSDENLSVWATLFNGLFVVPASFGLVFVVNMVVLALEHGKKKPDQAHVEISPKRSLATQIIIGIFIALLVGVVGLMAFLAIWFSLR